MKIGLTYTGSPAKHQNYVDWIKGTVARQGGETGGTGEAGRGAEIEVIRFSVEDDNFEEIRRCDGLVLSGGVDIHPDLYGGSPVYIKAPADGWEKGRDLFEKSLFEFARERGLPVLGVCRGLQLINVCLRGSLVQDLGEQGDAIHENVKEDKRHPVLIEAGTLLSSIAGTPKGIANSAHHQAIDRLGEGLVVNSRAEDGTIEGIEWEAPGGKPFMVAVQWHPERMFINGFADSFLYRSIRDRYIEEVLGSANKREK
ncbi:MAG: gamma-glutamyl-gamma-aminobutyrate hydrolase family protein [Puia sp.]|nr:gamma-glutamyl-gamma-aminobutyrate hydrolase family protein [Puia sp.]